MYSCTHLDLVLGGPASVLEWAEVSGVTELGHLIIPVSHECGRAHHYMHSVYRRYFVADIISKDAMEVNCTCCSHPVYIVHAQTE